VESPLQLLGAVEAFAAGVLGPRAQVAAYRPVPTMAATATALTRLGLPPGLSLRLAHPTALARNAPGAIWAVGDVFSFPVQLRLAAGVLADGVALLDDGLATTAVVGTLVSPAGPPLIRNHEPQARWRHHLGSVTARRLRRLAAQGRLAACTAFSPEPTTQAAWRALGGRLFLHDFAWLRRTPSSPAPRQATVVLGSALARDGLIRPDAYYNWVADAIRGRGPAAYFPHRREDRAELAARLPTGLEVVEAGVPVELALRGLGPDHTVFSLPSTAAVTLGRLLAGAGTEIAVTDIPADWWTDRASR
jgi:hypothetical protein